MFYSTEDAIKQGLNADYFTRQRWVSLRDMFKDQCKRALDKRFFDLAFMFATQSQFCREALMAKDIDRQFELDRKIKEITNQC